MQKKSDGSEFGLLGNFNGTVFSPVASGENILAVPGEQLSIKAFTTNYNGEKFFEWDNGDQNYLNYCDYEKSAGINSLTANFNPISTATIFNALDGSNSYSGNISFKDPWFRDDDTDELKGIRNRGVNAIYHSEECFNITTSSDYHGIFLNQNVNFLPDQLIYSVEATSTQDVTFNNKNIKIYFQNWQAEPENSVDFEEENSAQTHVVFKQSGATIKAVMKGTNITDEPATYRNSNQRKVIQVGNYFVSVYESMGKVWIEQKLGTTGDWELANNGNPIVTTNAKSPSLDFNTNPFQIIFQEEIENGYAIKIAEYSPSSKEVTSITELYETLNGNYSFDAQPSFTIVGRNCLAIWRVEELGSFNDEPGIYYARAYCDNELNEYDWLTGYTKIANTTANSQNASVVGLGSPWGYFAHLVWQEGNESIKYQYAEFTNALNDVVEWEFFSEVSAGCGTSINTNPSMVVLMSSPLPRVVWLGKTAIYYEDPTKSSNTDVIIYNERLILRGLQGEIGGTVNWNPQEHKFGSNVDEPLISRAGYDDYIVGWSQSSAKKFIINSNWTIRSFGISGEGLELTYASEMDNVRALTINELGSDQTNEILFSNDLDQILPKVNRIITSTGREGIIYKNGMQFLFTFADINLDGTLIEFKDIDTEAEINNLADLNSMLTTKPFNVSDQTDLQVSLRYTSLNPEQVANDFADNDFVKFRLELVDVSNNEVLGIYDNISFTKKNYSNSNIVTYEITTDGIGNRNVILRLVVNENIEANYSLAHIFAEDEVISKTNKNEISYAGDLAVTEYGLAQNYPNPFNPITTINYQIPETGNVIIKIFDILGREITTLVNEQKKQGVYKVEFDASNLSSGVYLYNIQVNDYSNTKKMILLK